MEATFPVYFFLAIGVILGLIIGSFLATLVVRWPQNRSVLRGRSHCDSCGATLGILDLIPVASHLFHKGKCRSCGARIGNHHLAMELTAALIGGLAFYIAPGAIGLAGAVFGWLLLTLAALDAENHWLPDQLNVLLAATGLLSALFIDLPTILERLLGGLFGYFSLLLVALVYRVAREREGLGGGDPKMLGAIGLWLGWQYLPLVLLGASLVGLIFVLLAGCRGKKVGLEDQFPLGSLMAIAAFPLWLLQVSDVGLLR